MSVDVDAMAAEVVLLLKSALTPVLARVTAVEAELKTIGELRERVAVAELKAGQVPAPAPPVDLTPVLARLDTADANLAALMVPKAAAAADDDEGLAASLTGLLRKDLAGLEPAPRIQRRVIRDGAGRVERVVDEPIT